MPPIASCALYRQNPPLVSASRPYVSEPPCTGLASDLLLSWIPAVVAGPAAVVSEEPLPLLPPPHADATTASAATAANAVITRDLRLRTTVPPDSSRVPKPRRIRPM